jgi:uncharacterized glyoxalase superfamily protein PhnB
MAAAAGASMVFPVGEECDLGRVVDAYGHHWETGRELVA